MALRRHSGQCTGPRSATDALNPESRDSGFALSRAPEWRHAWVAHSCAPNVLRGANGPA